jgi:hypothetical protein
VEAAVGGQAQVEVRISQTAGGRARGTRVGRWSTCDSVGANGCALDREGSARGSGAPVPWAGAGGLLS